MPDVHAHWYWDETGGGATWRKTKLNGLWIWNGSVWKPVVNCWIWDQSGLTWRLFYTNDPGLPASISISPNPGSIDVTMESTLLFTATLYDQDGLTTTGTVTWSVLGSGAGSIDSSGYYTPPTTDGTYTVQAACNGHTATASVVVSGNGV